MSGIGTLVAGSVVGRVASTYALPLIVGGLALFSGMIVWHLWSDHRIEVKLSLSESRVRELQAEQQQLLSVNMHNRGEISRCVAVNAENTALKALVDGQVAAGVAKAEANEQVRKEREKGLQRRGQEARGKDTGCRSVDEPLPDWFIADLLRDP